MAGELCQDELGSNACDRRRPVTASSGSAVLPCFAYHFISEFKHFLAMAISQSASFCPHLMLELCHMLVKVFPGSLPAYAERTADRFPSGTCSHSLYCQFRFPGRQKSCQCSGGAESRQGVRIGSSALPCRGHQRRYGSRVFILRVHHTLRMP